MKIIRVIELAAALDCDQPVEVLDIRPREDFDHAHIPGAHWLAAAAVSPETIVCCRELLASEPLYLVSQSGALAQLTACELEKQGLDNVVIVAGGMRAWLKQSLPVTNSREARQLTSV